jgi:hypothetical protein
MVEKLLSVDYLSMSIEIIITVVLIPIAMNIYAKMKNWHKKLVAEKILITKLNDHLDLLVPYKFKDRDHRVYVNNINYILLKFGIMDIAHIIPFSIKANSMEEMQKHFVRILKQKNEETYEKYQIILKEIKKDLEVFLSAYADVFNRKIFREFYKLDYQIQTQEYNFTNEYDLCYEIYAETIGAVIDVLDEMRKLILKRFIPLY